MSDIEIITFGCRLNAYESEVMREHAAAAGLTDAVIVNTCAVTAEAVRQARQAIRKARRERPGRQDHRHRLRGADRSRAASPPWTRSITSSAIRRSSRPGPSRASASRGRERVVVNDIMSVTRDRLASDRRLRQPRAGLCADPERLRPSLHLLHHPVRPRAVALGAGGRGGGASAAARREAAMPRSC